MGSGRVTEGLGVWLCIGEFVSERTRVVESLSDGDGVAINTAESYTV